MSYYYNKIYVNILRKNWNEKRMQNMNQKCAQKFLKVCHLIQANGLTSGSGGNVSIKTEEGILITPTGRSLESLKLEDLVLLHKDGSYICKNGGSPSKEWRMHLACYLRDEINAVVHVHSIHAVALSCMKSINENCAIPIYTPGYAIRVGKLPLLPYLTPGSIELCDSVAKVIKKRNSVLLANHGSIAVGKDIETALNLIEEIENEAKLFFLLGENGRYLSEKQQMLLKSYK